MLSKLNGGINAAAYVNAHAIVRLLLIAIMIYQELIMFKAFICFSYGQEDTNTNNKNEPI